MDESQNPPHVPMDISTVVLTPVSGQTSVMASLDTNALIAARQGAAWKISGWPENITIHHTKGCACCHKYINHLLSVVIKYNEPSFIKKSIKTKELKTETRNDPLTTHTCTQTIHSRRIHAPKRSPTSIGPGDQSEEAYLPVTTDRHQSRGDTTNESRRRRTAYTHRPRATRNKQQNAVTAGQTRTDAQYAQTTVTAYTPYRGGFHPSLHSILVLLFLSSPRSCRQGLMYTRYRYKVPPQENNPHLFPITS